MLHQVLNEFKSAQGALNLSDLARKLKVEQSALDGMIQFWVRKGRIEDSQLANSPAAWERENSLFAIRHSSFDLRQTHLSAR
ncbi:MAG: hypothetical protein B6243_12755 [Anaerolineaceae bacterium 4572_5.2]|nr:MAG: hypothetical protein B6243_12755 [Anaerolineaceae bacterium 4572_5.2]